MQVTTRLENAILSRGIETRAALCNNIFNDDENHARFFFPPDQYYTRIRKNSISFKIRTIICLIIYYGEKKRKLNIIIKTTMKEIEINKKLIIIKHN